MPRPSPTTVPAPDPAEPLVRLARFLRQADTAVSSWERYTIEHTDLDGWPFDQDVYDAREAEKDRALWRAFAPVRDAAADLLNAAGTAVAERAWKTGQSRWTWQLDHLREALDRITAAQDTFLQFLTDEPHATEEAVQAAAAARHARASEALSDWLHHGRSVLEVHAATVRAGQPGIRLAASVPRAATPAPAGPARRR
ncbi:hypothetical protein SLA_7135 [Streptomyces laurentii]|uniref:Uncharacterized protein n=1 Tax=Streptomyces laurentii TaxID=39478 RepID=A0A160P9J9_STRLU|nr:hypothetical protein SLA_7135 [Streptomyces laurentii]